MTAELSNEEESQNEEATYSPSRLGELSVRIKLESVQALKEVDIQRRRLETLKSKRELAETKSKNAWKDVERIEEEQQSVKDEKESFEARRAEQLREQEEVLEERKKAQEAMRTNLRDRKLGILEEKEREVQKMRQEREYLRAYQYEAKNYEQEVLEERSEYIKNDINNIQQQTLEKRFERANQAKIEDLVEAIQLSSKAKKELDEAERLKDRETETKYEIEQEISSELEARKTLKMTLE